MKPASRKVDRRGTPSPAVPQIDNGRSPSVEFSDRASAGHKPGRYQVFRLELKAQAKSTRLATPAWNDPLPALATDQRLSGERIQMLARFSCTTTTIWCGESAMLERAN